MNTANARMANTSSGFFYIHNANFHPPGEGFYKRDETQFMTVQSNKNYQKTGKRGRDQRQFCEEQRWLETTRGQSYSAMHHHHKKTQSTLILKPRTQIIARLGQTFSCKEVLEKITWGGSRVSVAKRFKSRLGKPHQQRCTFSGFCLRAEREA